MCTLSFKEKRILALARKASRLETQVIVATFATEWSYLPAAVQAKARREVLSLDTVRLRFWAAWKTAQKRLEEAKEGLPDLIQATENAAERALRLLETGDFTPEFQVALKRGDFEGAGTLASHKTWLEGHRYM